jgi:6-phosphogluconate dehydrogenase
MVSFMFCKSPHLKLYFTGHMLLCCQSIAAKAGGEPCCDWVGEDGAGHFVKMVHNGIEYGDMQLICEAYHLMKTALSLTNQEMSEVCIIYCSAILFMGAY